MRADAHKSPADKGHGPAQWPENRGLLPALAPKHSVHHYRLWADNSG